MKVYVVTETTGEYSNKNTEVSAVFSNRELADEHAVNMAALSDIPRESSQGDFDVAEVEVWDIPGERITEYRISAHHGPGYLEPRRRPYRVERYVPPAFQAALFGSELSINKADPRWFSIFVAARTEGECMVEYLRLMRDALTERVGNTEER